MQKITRIEHQPEPKRRKHVAAYARVSKATDQTILPLSAHVSY